MRKKRKNYSPRSLHGVRAIPPDFREGSGVSPLSAALPRSSASAGSSPKTDQASDRLSRDIVLMATAVIFSHRSTCRRKKVGAVLSKEGRILATGYAGAPAGLPHCSPTVCDLAQPCRRTIHAEINTLVFAARYGISTDGATLYCTCSPCLDCAKAIINAGIKRVVYYELYRDPEPLALLAQVGIPCEQSDIDGVFPL